MPPDTASPFRSHGESSPAMRGAAIALAALCMLYAAVDWTRGPGARPQPRSAATPGRPAGPAPTTVTTVAPNPSSASTAAANPATARPASAPIQRRSAELLNPVDGLGDLARLYAPMPAAAGAGVVAPIETARPPVRNAGCTALEAGIARIDQAARLPAGATQQDRWRRERSGLQGRRFDLRC